MKHFFQNIGIIRVGFYEIKTINLVLFILTLAIIIERAFIIGHDVNVYLYASGQILNGENIYSGNPFNNYLYSPLFALILSPLSFLNMNVARVFFALLNLFLTLRMWQILLKLTKQSVSLTNRQIKLWNLFVFVISIGFLMHNINLGQITILILWLTIESLYQLLFKERLWLGAILLALGINIKIIPLLALFYIFIKGRFKASFLTGGFVVMSLFLPAIFIGFDYNNTLLENWAQTINPGKEKYVFENNGGTQSLNAVLPAYFFDFNDQQEGPARLPRLVYSVDYQSLVVVLQGLRLIFVGLLVWVVLVQNRKRNTNPLFFLHQIGLLALTTAIIFPHQQKYAMLYFVPAGAYMILFILGVASNLRQTSVNLKLTAFFAALLMWVLATMGRDIYGDLLVNISDYYHFPGLNNIVFFAFLLRIKPETILKIFDKPANLRKDEID